MARHFCASVFLINPEDKRILLVKHKKFNKWVQPGGHIEDEQWNIWRGLLGRIEAAV